MLQQLLVFGLFSIIRVIGPRFAESWTIGFKHVVRPSVRPSVTRDLSNRSTDRSEILGDDRAKISKRHS